MGGIYMTSMNNININTNDNGESTIIFNRITNYSLSKFNSLLIDVTILKHGKIKATTFICNASSPEVIYRFESK